MHSLELGPCVGACLIDDNRLALARVDGEIDAFDLGTGDRLWHAADPQRVPLRAVVRLGAGSRSVLLAGGASDTWRVLNAADGASLDEWTIPGCPGGPRHGHVVAVTHDHSAALIECCQVIPPDLVAAIDAATTKGLTVTARVDAPTAPVLIDDSGHMIGRGRHVHSPFAFGPDLRVAYARSPTHWIGVEDLADNNLTSMCPHCYERGAYDIAFSRDGRWIAWSGYEKYVGPPESREFVRLVAGPPGDSEDGGRNVLQGAADYVSLRFSPYATGLAAGTIDGAVEWVALDDETATPQVLGRVDGAIVLLEFLSEVDVVALSDTGELCRWQVT